jgi:serine/threonine protein kinase
LARRQLSSFYSLAEGPSRITDAAQLMRTRYPAGMPERDVSAIVTAIAGAHDYTDRRGLSHREVKPSNILLSDPADGTETADLPARA